MISLNALKPFLNCAVFTPMSQPRLAAIVILGVTTITAAGFAYHHYQRAEELAARLAAEQAKPIDLTADRSSRITDIRAEPKEATAAPVKASAKAEEESAEEPEERRQERGGDRGRRDMGERIAAIMADPEYAEALSLQQRSRLDRTYADLFAQLDLPPATLARLQDLLVEKQNTARDVFTAAREEGFGREDRDEIRTLMQQTQAEIDTDITAAIGQSGFDTLQNYEQTGQQRALVGQFESRLSYSSTPLNSTQAQVLTTILADTAPAQNRGRGGDSQFGGGGVSITDEAISRASGVLSGEQLQSLQDLQAEQQAGLKLAEAMRSDGDGSRAGGRNSRGGGGG